VNPNAPVVVISINTMGKGKDKAKRKRRVTQAQLEASRIKRAAKKQKEEQRKHGSVLGHFRCTQETDTATASITENANAETGDGNAILEDDKLPPQDDDIFVFSEEVEFGSADEDPLIVANLDIGDEDADVDIDEDPEPENEQSTKQK
jgi:hypothetical protein